jgi:NTP pyrophosphatase (non-canonical NTP hydrolase)
MTTHYTDTDSLPPEEVTAFIEAYKQKLGNLTTPFKDVDDFHTACDQLPSKETYDMYLDLIEEEYGELQDAIDDNDKVEQLDALVDILVVTMGAIRTGGFDGEGAWNEVMRTNFAKVDPVTGKVIRRKDGKILKPDGWQGPELAQFIK